VLVKLVLSCEVNKENSYFMTARERRGERHNQDAERRQAKF